MTSRPSTAAPILAALAIVLALLGIYVGGYLAMLAPSAALSISMRTHVDRYPAYRFGGEPAKWFFAPASYVDQLLRPEYWHEIR
jgi:hypothetical protein